MLLIYYGILSLVFAMGGSVFTDGSGYSSNIALNDSDLSSEEIDTGGIFGTGISFGRFVALITFGVGLPDDTPSWFSLIFILWQSLITILSIGWLIASIWDG